KWIYYKLYAGVRTCNKLLIELIKPLTKNLISRSLIDKWFFIRYADPDNHIRLRMHSTEEKHIGDIINSMYEMSKRFINHQQLWKVQTDTYVRETERYGTGSIELAESWFHFDSELIINVIDKEQKNPDKDRVWLFSFIAVDKLMEDFGLSLKEKYSLIDLLNKSYGEEFNINRILKSQLDKKYRKNNQRIEQLLDSFDNQPISKEFMSLICKRSEKQSKIVNQILLSDKNKCLEVELNTLIASFIHMMLNRLFRSQQRLHELVIYNFLSRYYKSKIARSK
ncbi:thiopeptide-type bacteriocin biosynthesis protein, partial [Bacteroidota bacterium]